MSNKIKIYKYGNMEYIDGTIDNPINIKKYNKYQLAYQDGTLYLVYEYNSNTIYHEMIPAENIIPHIIGLLAPNKNFNRLADKTIAKIIADNIEYIEIDKQYNKLIIELNNVNHYLRFEDVDCLGLYGLLS